MYKCLVCGAEIEENDVIPVDVHEDWGDVCCRKCPECGSIEYEGFELFKRIEQP